jgi:hypothetical protein
MLGTLFTSGVMYGETSLLAALLARRTYTYGITPPSQKVGTKMPELFSVNENRRIVTPDGEELSGNQVLDLLNKFWTAYVTMHAVWRIVGEASMVMDMVYLGTLQEVGPDEHSDAGDGEHGTEVASSGEQEADDDATTGDEDN